MTNAWTDSAPEDSCDAYTEEYLEDLFEAPGDAARQECIDLTKASNRADTVEIHDVDVNGTTATALITDAGGEELIVHLVNENDHWLIDDWDYADLANPDTTTPPADTGF